MLGEISDYSTLEYPLSSYHGKAGFFISWASGEMGEPSEPLAIVSSREFLMWLRPISIKNEITLSEGIDEILSLKPC